MSTISKFQKGFTLAELIVVIAFALFLTLLFVTQKKDALTRNQDATAKQDINAVYYYLEGVYLPAHHGYPATLDANQLKGLDPESLKDENGKAVNNKESTYTYQPSGCQDNLCAGYKLSAKLQKEADFVKTNPVPGS